MPFYEYTCPAGHVTEARRGHGESRIPCACGEAAQRVPFSESCYLIGDTVPKGQAKPGAAGIKDKYGRWKLGLMQEAQAEVTHAYERAERPAPNLYQQGLAKARQLGAPIRS